MESVNHRRGRPCHAQAVVHEIPFDWDTVDRQFAAQAAARSQAQDEQRKRAAARLPALMAQDETANPGLRRAA
jgi:hypothetical protein